MSIFHIGDIVANYSAIYTVLDITAETGHICKLIHNQNGNIYVDDFGWPDYVFKLIHRAPQKKKKIIGALDNSEE